jgi:hypothetical protein
LKPIVRADGSITAGNASGVNDGAAALIVASQAAVNKYGLTPRARVLGAAVAGVDPWGNGSLPGYGDLRNFELLVEAGFTPEEAIKVMSANGATLLGELDRRGTIEMGKIADLAVIRGHPVMVPTDIYEMTLVFRDGVGYDSVKLIESVKGQVGAR